MSARRHPSSRVTWRAAGVLFAMAVTIAATPLPDAWKNWQYSRAIDISTTETPRLASAVVSVDVFRRSHTGLRDLRVIDDLGDEVPFVIWTRDGSTNTVSLPTTLRENSYAPGDYTQMVLDLGDNPKFHNTLEIQTREPDFIEWVSVEASDDARLWRIVQTRAPFFRFRKEGLQGTQTISYSENNARYLRVHILDGAEQFQATGARVLYKTVVAPESVPVDVVFIPSASQSTGNSSWTADFGVSEMPVSGVHFDVGAPAEFIRSVDISASDDNQEWRFVARGEIYRYKQAGAAQEQSAVSIPSYGGARGRYWRIEIANGNDKPLEEVNVRVSATPRHIVFEQQPGRTYRLIYGQSLAEAPQYDLKRRIDFKHADAATTAISVGPEEENSDYSDPRPWTEKNRYFLWVVLGIAVLLLGYSAIQSLRRSSSDSTQNP
jgi:hypothetical protein